MKRIIIEIIAVVVAYFMGAVYREASEYPDVNKLIDWDSITSMFENNVNAAAKRGKIVSVDYGYNRHTGTVIAKWRWEIEGGHSDDKSPDGHVE